MPRDIDLLHALATAFPVILSLEAGRYLVAAGLASFLLWALSRVQSLLKQPAYQALAAQ